MISKEIIMGDRVLFQAYKNGSDKEVGPVVYGHWSGQRAPEVCRKLALRMKERPGDVQYTTARTVQELIAGDEGALSFGCWNSPSKLTANDSHGDAGVILIECAPSGLKFHCLGGYLKTGKDGFPTE
jgi:hypothetical protein